jgi:hypothetical protein
MIYAIEDQMNLAARDSKVERMLHLLRGDRNDGIGQVRQDQLCSAIGNPPTHSQTGISCSKDWKAECRQSRKCTAFGTVAVHDVERSLLSQISTNSDAGRGI